MRGLKFRIRNLRISESPDGQANDIPIAMRVTGFCSDRV